MTDTQNDITTAEEQMLTTFMQRLHAAPIGVSARMPSADILWLKAQLIRQWEVQRRVRRPMDIMEPIELAAGIAAAVSLLAWSVPSAFDWLPRLMF